MNRRNSGKPRNSGKNFGAEAVHYCEVLLYLYSLFYDHLFLFYLYYDQNNELFLAIVITVNPLLEVDFVLHLIQISLDL